MLQAWGGRQRICVSAKPSKDTSICVHRGPRSSLLYAPDSTPYMYRPYVPQ